MKSCFEQLKENCINCNNSKMVDGDYCHALRAYQQGKADERVRIIKILDSADDSGNAMYLLGKYLIAEQLDDSNDTKSPCCYCKSDMASCCGCPEYFEWKKQKG